MTARVKLFPGIAACPVCSGPLGPESVRVGDGQRSEWICLQCLSAIEAALARWRVGAFVAGGLA